MFVVRVWEVIWWVTFSTPDLFRAYTVRLASAWLEAGFSLCQLLCGPRLCGFGGWRFGAPTQNWLSSDPCGCHHIVRQAWGFGKFWQFYLLGSNSEFKRTANLLTVWFNPKLLLQSLHVCHWKWTWSRAWRSSTSWKELRFCPRGWNSDESCRLVLTLPTDVSASCGVRGSWSRMLGPESRAGIMVAMWSHFTVICKFTRCITFSLNYRLGITWGLTIWVIKIKFLH